MANNILRLPQVLQRTGLARSTIYQHIAEGIFPRPISLGLRAVGWLESDLEEWVAKRIADSEEKGERFS
jgi:prophage regulatory protein